MDWLEAEVRAPEAVQEAIAEILTEEGCQGVVIEDPRLIETLRARGTWELCDIPVQKELGTVSIKAYYPADGTEGLKAEHIRAALATLTARMGPSFSAPELFCRRVHDEDWAECWKKYFHVTKIGKNLVIRPSWEEYRPLPQEKVLTIDPGLAFGTGSHHTTKLCMELIEEFLTEKEGTKVLDLGTGSGILSLTAALCGAKEVLAVDIDPVAVRVAKENVAENDLEKTICVQAGDLFKGIEGRADLIIANILAPIIIRLLPEVPAHLAEGGLFLASGIIIEQQEEVMKAAEEAGLVCREVREEGGWLALALARRA